MPSASIKEKSTTIFKVTLKPVSRAKVMNME